MRIVDPFLLVAGVALALPAASGFPAFSRVTCEARSGDSW